MIRSMLYIAIGLAAALVPGCNTGGNSAGMTSNTDETVGAPQIVRLYDRSDLAEDQAAYDHAERIARAISSRQAATILGNSIVLRTSAEGHEVYELLLGMLRGEHDASMQDERPLGWQIDEQTMVVAFITPEPDGASSREVSRQWLQLQGAALVASRSVNTEDSYIITMPYNPLIIIVHRPTGDIETLREHWPALLEAALEVSSEDEPGRAGRSEP